MTKITIFKNIRETDTPFVREDTIILDRIKEGKSKELIKKIRKENNKTERNEMKKELPSICFSGTFKKRGDQYLEQHSGLICLDFDGYEKQKELLQDKEVFTKNKYVYSVFISPSGKGLKVLVKIPAEADNHTSYFNALEKYFNNPHFDVTSPLTDENKVIERLVKWWSGKYPMVEGQRNNHLYVLARSFNDFGVSRSLAEYVAGQYANDSFPLSEIRTTIDSAYRNTETFHSRYFEDDAQVNEVKMQIKRGVPRKEIRSQLEDLQIEGGAIDSVLNRLEEEHASQVFWEVSERGRVRIVHILFKHFLEENGFYKYNPEGSKN
jgi:hypothetical protein